MNQGDIYLVNLDPVIQTEAGKTRPGVILSMNAMNHHSPRVIVAPITSTVTRVYPFEILVPAGTAGLSKDSKIMLDQIRSIDKKRLVRKLGSLNRELLSSSIKVLHKLVTVE